MSPRAGGRGIADTDAMLTFDNDTLTVNGTTYSLKPLGEVRPVIHAGGIFNYARASGVIAVKA